MASNLHTLLSTLIFLSTILQHPSITTSQECPYPCYPPPTGPGNSPPPVTTTPPASTTPQASNFPPPVYTSPPGGGYTPFTPPSPPFYGAVPPPPEPMLPWLPFYYRRPPHKDVQDQSYSSPTLKGSIKSTIALLLLFPFLFNNFH